MALTRQQAEAVLTQPSVRAFLDVISDAEGTARQGYHTEFGGGRLQNLEQHPGTSQTFTDAEGNERQTTAAGRYQFLKSTWDEHAEALNLEDFGPHSQDLAAIAELERHGALQPLLEGDTRTALREASSSWVSLPDSDEPQPHRSFSFIQESAQRRGLPVQDLPAQPVEESAALAQLVSDQVQPEPMTQAPEIDLPADAVQRALTQIEQEDRRLADTEQALTQASALEQLGLEQTQARERIERILESTGRPPTREALDELRNEMVDRTAQASQEATRVNAQRRFAGLPEIEEIELPQPLTRRIDQLLRGAV